MDILLFMMKCLQVLGIASEITFILPAKIISPTTEDRREYTAPIDHYPTVPAGEVTFYYLDPPDAVNLEKVPSAVP
jgi:hypothetical protein